MSVTTESILNDITNDISNIVKYDKSDITKLLKKAIYSYYNTDTPIMTDALYDIVVEEYNKHNNINLLGVTNKNNKSLLDYWMGSINKVKNTINLNTWKKKFPQKSIITDKLDGVSALLIYTSNNIKLYTRGDGTYGTNISHILKYIKHIIPLNNINTFCSKENIVGNKNKLAFRGELVIKKKTFYEKWSPQFKNSRNMISGIVNCKDTNIELCKDIELVLYEIIDPVFDFRKQLEIITKLKFNCVNYKKIDNINEITDSFLSEYLKKRKEKSLYEIDGIIITTLDNYVRNTNGNPEYSIAYKTLDVTGIKTSVIDIKWNISKDGFLIPVIYIEPVTINNVIIKKTLGFNAKYIIDNNIGIGTVIEIVRSGDVIPYITKVYINNKITPLLPPNDIEWEWYNDIDIILKNKNNSESYKVKNIFYFFSKLETKGLGIKNIEKMYNKGFNTIIKIITITKQDLLTIDTFKDKTADNILNEIAKLKQGVNILNLIVASNKLSHGIGIERIKMIFDMDPYIINNFNKLGKQWYYDKIIQLSGFSIKTTKLFIDSFDTFIDFYTNIKKYINIISINTDNTDDINKNSNIIKNTFFDNKVFVFSGFTDKQLEKKIIDRGGIIKATYVKNLNFLIINDKKLLEIPTGKIKKAIHDDKKIILIDEIYKKL